MLTIIKIKTELMLKPYYVRFIVVNYKNLLQLGAPKFLDYVGA